MSVDSSKTQTYPKVNWGPLATILLVIFGFGVVPPVASLLVTFLPHLFGWDSIRIDEWILNSPSANFIYILLAEAMTLLSLVWFVSYKRFSFIQAVGLRRPQWRDLGYAVLGFLAYICIFAVLTTILKTVLPIDTGQEQALGYEKGIGGSGLIMAAISLIVLPPLIEEIFFRGFLFGTLRSKGLGFIWSMICTSLIFGLLHLPGGLGGSLIWIAFIDTCILSVAMCYVRERSGSIVATIIMHVLKNSLAFINLFILANS